LDNGKPITNWDAAAEKYDQAAHTFEPFAEWLGRLCAMRKGMSVLDVGCGTGVSSFVAAQFVGRQGQVVGIDISQRMIEVAREKAATKGFSNVHFIIGSTEKIGVANESFNNAISNFSLHLFDDEVLALKEMMRVVKPGGKVAWTVPAQEHAKEMITAFKTACDELGLPLSSKDGKPIKPERESINRSIYMAGMNNTKIHELKKVFHYEDLELFKRVVNSRIGRLVSRVSQEHRNEVMERTIVAFTKGKGNFTFTCHAYGIVYEKH